MNRSRSVVRSVVPRSLWRAFRGVLAAVAVAVLHLLVLGLSVEPGRRLGRRTAARLGAHLESVRARLGGSSDDRLLSDRVAELEVAQASLVAAVVRSGVLTDAGTGVRLPQALVGPAVRGLVDEGEVLDAYRVAQEAGALPVLDRRVARRLATGLARRGYLRRAGDVFGAMPEAHLGAEERRRYALVASEAAVLSGEFVPVAAHRPVDPVPGRILHLVGNSLPEKQSGYTLRTHYTVRAQREVGLDPHVATHMGFGYDGRGGDHAVTVDVDGVPYHRLPGPPRSAVPFDAWLQGHVDGVSDLAQSLRPAVLHAASDFVNALTADVVGRACGIPVVYEARGFWEETWLSRQAQRYGWADLDRLRAAHGLPDGYEWRRGLEDRLRCRADRVVTLADVMADRIVAGGVPRERVTVVPNGVHADTFPVLSRDRELAARLGIADDAVVLGYISSIVEYEGIDTLVAAYAAVKASSTVPVALLVVGDGPDRDRVMRQAADLGVADAIFPGQVPHDAVLGYYSLIDVFVVPRRPVEVCHLVTPLKPFEAFATGRTVVLSDVRALASIAAASGAAELFQAGDPGSLAAVLSGLLADPGRRAKLAATGAEWVRRERTWSANARAYLRLYEELGAARRPAPVTANN